MQEKILALDDEEIICDLVARNLKPYGCKIDRAHNVKDPIEYLLSTFFLPPMTSGTGPFRSHRGHYHWKSNFCFLAKDRKNSLFVVSCFFV